MRVLHISLHFAEYALQLSRALAGDHEVLTVLSQANAANELIDPPDQLNEPNLETITLRDYQLKDPRVVLNASALARVVRRFDPEVVHCQEAYRDYLAAVMPLLKRSPLVLTIHDHKPHSGRDSRVRRRIALYQRWFRKRAAAIIVHGERVRQETEALLPDMRGRVCSLPHGPIGQVPGSPDITATGWDPGHLLFFGRIEEYKGLTYLLDALEVLQHKGRRVHLTIAGRGDDLDRHRRRIASNPGCTLLDRYIAPVEIAPLFKKAQIIILPYTDATQSGVAAMALRFGRPVVTTDVGSVPELVLHEQNGLVVPPKNVPALAEAIDRLILDASLSARLGQYGIYLSEHDFSWPVIAKRTTSVYENTLRHWHAKR